MWFFLGRRRVATPSYAPLECKWRRSRRSWTLVAPGWVRRPRLGAAAASLSGDPLSGTEGQHRWADP